MMRGSERPKQFLKFMYAVRLRTAMNQISPSQESETHVHMETCPCITTDSRVNHGKIGRPENAVHIPSVMRKQRHPFKQIVGHGEN